MNWCNVEGFTSLNFHKSDFKDGAVVDILHFDARVGEGVTDAFDAQLANLLLLV